MCLALWKQIISKNTRKVDFTKNDFQPMKINCQTEFNELFFILPAMHFESRKLSKFQGKDQNNQGKVLSYCDLTTAVASIPCFEMRHFYSYVSRKAEIPKVRGWLKTLGSVARRIID